MSSSAAIAPQTNTKYIGTGTAPWRAVDRDCWHDVGLDRGAVRERVAVATTVPVTIYDSEQDAIKALCDAMDKLQKLDDAAWQRVADYIAGRYGVTITADDEPA